MTDLKIPTRKWFPFKSRLFDVLPSMEEAQLLAMDEAALLAALGISTKQKVAKTCYIGPPIEETNTTTNASDPDAEVDP